MLVGTFTFSFTLLAGVEENSVPNVGVTVTGVLMAADMFLFLFFLDRFVHRLRPVAVAAIAADGGQARVRRPPSARRAGRMRPRSSAGRWSSPASRRWSCAPAAPARSRRSTPPARPLRAGASLHARAEPRRSGTSSRPVRRVIRVYGGEPERRAGRAAPSRMVVLGVERTIEQDPAFAVRIMVDIAIKALSPAVNDPTTAVPGDQPSRRPAAPDRRDRLPHGGSRAERRDRTRPRRRARLGGVPRPRRDRDPRVRRFVGAGGAAAARDAGGAARRGAARVPRRRSRTSSPASTRRSLSRSASSPDLDRAREADRQGLGGAPPL